MKKGPWTSEEDAMLIEYVNKHGEGNWNKVHKNSGLDRCCKSCRLRWTNHLRPNLKKGYFSQDKQNAIIYLHSKLGNRWARMASLHHHSIPQLNFPNLGLVSPYASSSSSSVLPNHTFVAHPVHSLPLLNGCNTHISSIQTPPAPPNNDYYEVPPLSPQPNNGLLMEAQAQAHAHAHALSRYEHEDSTTLCDPSHRGKATTAESQRTGNKPSGEDPIGKDDDLFGLLKSFSSEMPMPDWYGGRSQSLQLESQSDISPRPTAQEFHSALGACWNNLPGMY